MYLSRLVKTSGKCEIKCEGPFTPPIFLPLFFSSLLPPKFKSKKKKFTVLKVRSKDNYLQIQMSNRRKERGKGQGKQYTYSLLPPSLPSLPPLTLD